MLDAFHNLAPMGSCGRQHLLDEDDYLKWILKNFSNPVLQQDSLHDLLLDLKSCSRKGNLQDGRRLHRNVVETGNISNMFVASALINMYAKCGSMVDARRVFDSLKKRNVVSWTTLILGYADNGEGQVALDFFTKMKAAQCVPNSVTYVAAIKACTSMAGKVGKAESLKCGRLIHSQIGHHLDHILQCTLISMYAKCGSMEHAWRVFDSIIEPDVASWSALILGYVDNGEGQVALNFFSKMKSRGCTPNSITYLAAIKACTSLAADEAGKKECLERGRNMHSEIGDYLNRAVQNAIINMYAECGSMVDAQRVFDSLEKPDVVSWTALILGYAGNGEGECALDLFSRMKAVRECTPNCVTYVAAIKACTSLASDEDRKGESLKRAREIHLEIEHHMDHVIQSTLINLYAKCGSMIEARRVFDSIKEPDVVSWSALILGYADNGEGQNALDYFSRMKATSGCAPNTVTYVAAIKACGSIGALFVGRKYHSEMTDFDGNVVTCLVDFYAKCGSMVEACEVFDSHSESRNVATWNSLLGGYGRFGDSHLVFNLFEAMQDQGFRPDAITFVSVLLSCSHAGLVEKAEEYLQAMPLQYGVPPSMIHYTCMVDVLGRANQLDKAFALMQKMPCIPDAVTWMALLGACRKWKNVEIGRLAFQSLRDLNEKNASAYALMAEIYGSRGMWKEQKRVLEIKKEVGNWKAFVIDGLGRMVAGEKDHPEDKQYVEGMKEYEYIAQWRRF